MCARRASSIGELFVKACGAVRRKKGNIRSSGWGDEATPGIHAVDIMRGHSPGMLAFHVESAGKRLLIWADTCNH